MTTKKMGWGLSTHKILTLSCRRRRRRGKGGGGGGGEVYRRRGREEEKENRERGILWIASHLSAILINAETRFEKDQSECRNHESSTSCRITNYVRRHGKC